MIRSVVILLILVSRVFSDSCVSYTFEDDFDTLFTSNLGICAGRQHWDIARFEESGLTGHHERSTKYIHPQATLSCTNSFVFPLALDGIVEINVFMESEVNSDLIQVMVMEYVPGGNDVFAGQAINSAAQQATFIPGWQTMSITVIGNNPEMFGYVSIMGMASPSSTVLVDSFKYIPPGMDVNECEIYQTMEPVSTSESSIAGTTETEFIHETTTTSTTEMLTESTTQSTSDAITESTTIMTTDAITKPTIIMTSDVTTESTIIITSDVTDSTTVLTTDAIEDIQTTQLSTTPILEDHRDAFWTPLRIKILVMVLILLLLLTLLCFGCYCCCRRNNQVSVVVVKG